MRVHQITCPHCRAGMNSKAGIPAGQTVSCPKCKRKFPVEGPDEADAIDDADVVEDFDDEPAPKKKGPPPVPGRKPAARRIEQDETEEDEPLPRKKGKKARLADDTEEEPLPRKKKRKQRRDEEEEGLYQRLKHNVLVRVITLVVLLGILAVVAYLFYELKIKQPAETTQQAPPAGRDE